MLDKELNFLAEIEKLEQELAKCRAAHSRVVGYIEHGGGWAEQARRIAMWHSVPGHPDDESSGPDAVLEESDDD